MHLISHMINILRLVAETEYVFIVYLITEAEGIHKYE